VNESVPDFCTVPNELSNKTALEYREWSERMERPLITISKMKKPVIAQLHGIAAANGMGLVASADLVISADNARMGLTAINVGLNCVGPVIPVARCVGRKKAKEKRRFTGRRREKPLVCGFPRFV
jgi:enoyl-CoA hydratase/carnithine racemase